MDRAWTPPPGWTAVETLDLHVAGEPLRILLAGAPEPAGRTILEKRRSARQEHDARRRLLLLEPRGHREMYGAWPVEAEGEDADLGVLFLHNEGFSTMCGHGILGLGHALRTTGFRPLRDPGRIRVDTPAGRVELHPEAGRALAFRNVPSFVLEDPAAPELEGRRLEGALAFGGAYYFFLEADRWGLSLEPRDLPALVRLARGIRAAGRAWTIRHPEGPQELGFLYGTIFTAGADGGFDGRQVCVFADGQVDRSPTGTGVSARAALEHARGRLEPGRWLRIASVLGTAFEVRILEETRAGGRPAVVPEVRGEAWITGRHRFLVEPGDPLAGGFLLPS